MKHGVIVAAALAAGVAGGLVAVPAQAAPAMKNCSIANGQSHCITGSLPHGPGSKIWVGAQGTRHGHTVKCRAYDTTNGAAVGSEVRSSGMGIVWKEVPGMEGNSYEVRCWTDGVKNSGGGGVLANRQP